MPDCPWAKKQHTTTTATTTTTSTTAIPTTTATTTTTTTTTNATYQQYTASALEVTPLCGDKCLQLLCNSQYHFLERVAS